MRAFIEIGDAEEALALHAASGGESGRSLEYIDALAGTHNYQQAAESACRIYRETKDPIVLRKYLDYLSRYDVGGLACCLCYPCPQRTGQRHPVRLHPAPEINR